MNYRRIKTFAMIYFILLSCCTQSLALAVNQPQGPPDPFFDAIKAQDPLYDAIRAQDLAGVRQYAKMAPGKYMGMSYLYWAAVYCAPLSGFNKPILPTLLDHGADVNTRFRDTRNQDEGCTVLMLVSSYNPPDHVRYLLDHGARVEAHTRGGRTALTYAAQGWASNNRSGPENTALLLARGAKVNEKDDQGWTPLIYAADVVSSPLDSSNERVVKLLLAHGAQVNVSAEDGATPLMYAARSNFAAVKLLLKHHAKVNVRDKAGLSALMYAVGAVGTREGSEDSPAIVRALIEAGGKVNLKDNEGNTVLDWANAYTYHRAPDFVLPIQVFVVLDEYKAKAGSRKCLGERAFHRIRPNPTKLS